MTVFDTYSKYYNLFYKDKDYAAEAHYVDHLIQNFKPGAIRILDLGCGTGQHDFFLAKKGYTVTGVDRSEKMLSVAASELEKDADPAWGSISFVQGDIRKIRLKQKFDVVISLFHVISYQPQNQDLIDSFETVYDHLDSGGVFIFDCWYGPGVLKDPPVVRIKKLEDETVSITRTAEPVMHAHENWVDVNYQILVKDKKTHQVEEIKERHRMRYLFKPEIEMIFENCGFRALAFMEFLKEDPPTATSWNACFVAIKD